MTLAEAISGKSGFSLGLPTMNSRLTSSGSLQEIPARHLVDYLHKRRFSGTLLLRYREKKKKIWFHSGEVFRIQSNLVPELIGRMMIDRAWLNEADLRTCLKIQQELLQRGHSAKKIGELVAEIHGVDEDEIHCLIEQQNLSSFLQATTWDYGEYEIAALELKSKPEALFSVQDVFSSLHSLFEVNPSRPGAIFDQMEIWHPDTKPVELSRMPMWTILAGCRRLGLSGIISVRRQNKLYEIVIKFGIPLTLYEGTFGQPRQTIVVRQASEEHERFFIEQVFKLFSFLTGTVHYRSLSEAKLSDQDDHSHLQFRDETAVTRSVAADDISFELSQQLLIQSGKWMRLLQKLRLWLSLLVRRA